MAFELSLVFQIGQEGQTMILLFIVAAMLASYLLVGYIIFHRACYRGKELNWHDPEAVARSPYKPFMEVIPMAEQWLQQY